MRARVEVPAEIYAWKADAAMHERALAVQGGNRERFQRAFGEGLSVLGYERDASGNGKFLLGEWDEGGGIEPKGALFPIDPGSKHKPAISRRAVTAAASSLCSAFRRQVAGLFDAIEIQAPV